MVVGLIGAGNFARALALGWGDPVLCSDAGSGRAHQLAQELGGEALECNVEVARRADEPLIGAAAAVSGVGPAYQALLVEAQVDAAVRRGVRTAFQSAIDAVIDGGSR